MLFGDFKRFIKYFLLSIGGNCLSILIVRCYFNFVSLKLNYTDKIALVWIMLLLETNVIIIALSNQKQSVQNIKWNKIGSTDKIIWFWLKQLISQKFFIEYCNYFYVTSNFGGGSKLLCYIIYNIQLVYALLHIYGWTNIQCN